MHLLDTNILSAGAPIKQARSAELIGWMDRASNFLFLSVVTTAEVEDVIANGQILQRDVMRIARGALGLGFSDQITHER